MIMIYTNLDYFIVYFWVFDYQTEVIFCRETQSVHMLQSIIINQQYLRINERRSCLSSTNKK